MSVIVSARPTFLTNLLDLCPLIQTVNPSPIYKTLIYIFSLNYSYTEKIIHAFISSHLCIYERICVITFPVGVGVGLRTS